MDATPPPFAEGRSTQRAEEYRSFLIYLNRDSNKRRGAAKGLPYRARTAKGKENLESGEPAKGALCELSMSGVRNGRDGVMANLINLINRYAQ